MHSLVIVDNEGIKKGKDVSKNVAKRIRHKEFVDVLFGRGLVRHRMERIQSKLRTIGTYDIFKISLSLLGDKRYILDDGVSSLAYLHWAVLS